MSQKSNSQKLPDPPRGLRAVPWRLPIWFYRLKLGWMLGHRMLLLNHIGRVSGKPRRAVLEVVHHDKEKNIHYVASGFGDQADWFKNLVKNPEVTIQAGGKTISVVSEHLPKSDAEIIFKNYHLKNPKALRALAKLIGYDLPDDDEKMLGFFREHIPIVSFRRKIG